MHALTNWWNQISLRTKITAVTVLLLTMGLLVVGIGTMTVLRNYLLDEVDKNLINLVDKLPTPFDLDGARTFNAEGASGLNPYYLAAVDAQGQLIDDNLAEGEEALRPKIENIKLAELEKSPCASSARCALTLSNLSRSAEWRVLAVPAGVSGTTEQATLIVGVNMGSANATISRLAAIFLFFGLTVVIFGGALTRLIVTSTFTPLREVEATAARFADGDFNQRIAGATPNTEVGRLNHSLNSMLGRIDHAFAARARTIDQMRRFVGDASHELRTPLVSVRGYAELYRMGALTTPDDVAQAMGRIEKEAIRMGELVEDLLELARLDEAKPLQLSEVDLVPLAHDAALDAMASAPDRVVTVVGTDLAPITPAVPEKAIPPTQIVDLPTPHESEAVPVRGVTALATSPIAFASATLARLVARRSRVREDEQQVIVAAEPPSVALRAVILAEENKIRQVLTNLIGNALRFTPAGSPLEIAVSVDESQHTAVISVIDHGEGIPPQIHGKIFERFYRADSSRQRATGGSGLGLAIVAAIIESHGGEVEVLSTLGGGATFRVSLPLLPRSSDAAALPSTPQNSHGSSPLGVTSQL
ncbi:MAG: sensor histidine kinase [Rhodoglobus sp.]